ncbi:hypothetical protein TARUN_2652 [Trichoderma arundinaceum]|uniref:F-box domain-containing protein n=1 Tax=Trichoderma arundinaceum TaxID=490622 RepID=A0A395NUD4_TRIAR|nr:hypothetical protein TARUN_2652 [Trichoderma arundinaceum]
MSQQATTMSGDFSPQAPSRFLQVPPEILDRITWHLTTPELCNLRLTCRAAELALHFRFTAEFFTRKQFMVSELSLGTLIDISKSRLAGHLRHVHLGLDQLDATANAWSNLSAETQRLYEQRLTEQSTLWTLGLVPKYLSEAFSRLPNLESVVVRDFNSNRRSRDGPHAHWRSYGSQTLFKETGVHPTPVQLQHWANPSQVDNASRLFKAIVHALGMANAKPKTIEVMERQDNLLHDSSFYIHPQFQASVLPVLQGLQRLHLCVDISWPPLSIARNAAQPCYKQHLTKFLHHCEALEELRINGRRNSPISGTRPGLHQLFTWLAATESTPAPEPPVVTASSSDNEAASNSTLDSPPVRLAHLANISLGMMTLTVNEIVQLVAKFADTLQYLELWRIQLIPDPGSNNDVLVAKRAILFTQLLKKLLDIPNLNLRHIKLGMLQQILDPNHRDLRMQEIDFKINLDKASTSSPTGSDTEVTAKDEPTKNFLEYTGSDWRHFVAHEMIPRLRGVPFPGELQGNDEDMDEDEDEDDDDMDNDDEE